jgi:hypothetical protein
LEDEITQELIEIITRRDVHNVCSSLSIVMAVKGRVTLDWTRSMHAKDKKYT